MRRIERLLALIQDTGNDGTLSVPARLCIASSAAVGVDGAGVSLIDAHHHSSVAASDDLAGEVEGLQASLGQGPCFDAVQQCRAIIAPDLTDRQVLDRWPEFARSALDAGIHAVFGFPLSIDGRPIGALDLYSRTPRHLTDRHINDALVLAISPRSPCTTASIVAASPKSGCRRRSTNRGPTAPSFITRRA